ncbi:MAG: glycosyltransferase family 2 protein [Gemmatimonadetes bacterium]|nr:glycosyltransferase family 2 protein [Gemmatimonadota bacterium]
MTHTPAATRRPSGTLPRPPAPGEGKAASRLFTVSIVVPMFNEIENVEPFVREVTKVLDESPRTIEVILVDDGSWDGTAARLREIPAADPRFRVILFRRNFGQTAAMSAGFDHARGDVIVAMDGDLQNDPRDLEGLVRKIEAEDWDIVSGWRKDRKDAMLSRRIPSRIANWLIGRITGVRLHDYGCSLKAYRAEVLRNVRLYGEMHRFIPALASWVGASITEAPVNHRAREKGVSKYGLGRTVRVILDLITVKFLLSFSTRPLQIFGLGGLVSFGTGMAISLYLTALKLFYGEPLSQRPLLMLGSLLIILGVQLLSMGLLAEISIRTYHESQSKATYVIREIVDSSSPARNA